MSLRIARALLFLASQYWLELATHPPHAGGDSTAFEHRAGDKVFSGMGFACFHHVLMTATRFSLRINCVCDVLLCLSPLLGLSPRSVAYNPALTPRIIAGAACIYACYIVRTHCYRQLGHMFTFVVTIRPEHRIVKSGVYAYVRHASYPASWAGLVGAVLLHAAPGNAFGVWAPWWLAWVVGSWVMWAVAIVVPVPLMYVRIQTEERVLEEEFGEEWRRYRKETWALVPFLY